MTVGHLRAALSRIVRSQSRLPTTSHAPPVVVFAHRLLASSVAAASSSRSFKFKVDDYLVSRCGLTRAQAVKAAAKLSHLRSRTKPEAVLTYLENNLGIPSADVGRVAVICPLFLCSDVERTLAPRVADLRDLGLSRDDIARLVLLVPNSFRYRHLTSNLEFWLAELGSFDKIVRAIMLCSQLLSTDLDKVTRPNVAFLQQCGMNISQIVTTSLYSTRLFTMNPKLLKDTVQRAEELGIDRGARMFRHALALVAFTDEEVVARRIRLLQNVGFSKDDVRTIVRKQPLVLALSEQKVQENANFLIKDVGLDVSYIVHRPVLLMYSVERRLLPRYRLLQVLREKGLLKGELDYYFTASMAEKIFLKKFVLPFKNHVPGIIDDYASKCLGEATDGIALPKD
nr:unnamed protein product [Digitaria exilis]